MTTSGSPAVSTLALFTGSTVVGNSGITDNGTTVTVNRNLSIVGTGPNAIQFFPQTFATLTTGITCNSGNAGYISSISDSTTQTWGANVTVGGGGFYNVLSCNGSNWTVIGK